MEEKTEKDRIKIKDVQPGDVISHPINPDTGQFLVEDSQYEFILTKLDADGFQSASHSNFSKAWKEKNGELEVVLHGKMESIISRKISWAWPKEKKEEK